ncbi:unnamed protein product [Miscanthus lutarioriparius]|uniref:PIN-like protein n=1 Tax=Miscanthus lutarioriparius TaxID=422564 RepID=A0A811Q508_9POAL|nr:unnamed protein product [Miscanthus lutarioriparius]
MTLAYGSVRCWRIFTPDQCSGINRFVVLFAVPLLCFHFISTNNPFTMNLRFLVADTLQKLAVLFLLFLDSRLSSSHFLGLDWSITLFSLSTLPNTLVMGIPLLRGMYSSGAASSSSASTDAGTLMVQIVILHTAPRALVLDQFPDGAAASIVSFRVDSDVVSLARGEIELEADAVPVAAGASLIGGDTIQVRVTVRKSTSSRSEAACSHSHSHSQSMQPRVSNLSGVEIYSLQSSRNPTPRSSSFNHADFFNIVGAGAKGGGAAAAAGDEEKGVGGHSPQPQAVAVAAKRKDLHMSIWSSSASPVSERATSAAVHVFGSGADDHADVLAKGVRKRFQPL